MKHKSPSQSILIVEDDTNTASLIALYLEREGFKTIRAADGQQALDLAALHKPIFTVLDLMLPNIDGWEVCRTLRRLSDVPILILSARREEPDRVRGFSLGADDYMIKPFSPRELAAKVKAILRRARPSPSTAAALLLYRGLRLDIDKRRVTLNGRPISLTASEFKLLNVLMAAPGRVFLRHELLNRLYPNGEAVIDRVIDVHISNVRQKIESAPATPHYIFTVRGIGYRFADGE